MREFEIQVKVAVLKSGQVRPYADSIYQYEVESNLSESETKRLCTSFIRRSAFEEPNGKYNGSCGFPHGLNSYYKFTKQVYEKYLYTVCEPYTG